MNLQKSNLGGANAINNFNMKVIEPIDAENHPKYITVLSVSYPLTTKNIVEDKCSFQVRMVFTRFRNSSKAGAGRTHTLNFTTDNIIIPDGLYDIHNIIDFMNNRLEEYNITLEILKNKKISIHMGYGVEYWIIQYRDAPHATVPSSINGGKLGYLQLGNPNDPTKGGMKIDIILSDKLKFILGGFEKLSNHHSTDPRSTWTY